MISKPDSLIFDMDGTLWDALDTYVTCWNEALNVLEIKRQLKRSDIDFMMGWEKKKLLEYLFPDERDELREEVYNMVNTVRSQRLAELGGHLYEGVTEGLKELSKSYSLFIVSNCPEGLIRLFIDWADIDEYITDEMAHGVNDKPKHYNIKLLIDKYRLKSPVYIGDTDTDSRESRLAGIPFIFMEGGFGVTDDYDLKFRNFTEFSRHFIQLAGQTAEVKL